MYYKLNVDYALRGWKDKPFCLLNLSSIYNKPWRIPASDFFLLLNCDGKCEIEDNALLQKWLRSGIVEAVSREDERSKNGYLNSVQEYILYPYVYRSEARVAITNRCNCKCKHCYVADVDGKNHDEISLEAFKSLAKQMVEMGMYDISLTGGEPLLHPQFNEIIKCIFDNKMRLTYLLTNGICVTNELLDLLEMYELKPVFQISFDGFGIHDWMRGVDGAEAKVINTLNLLKSRGYKIRIGMNVNGKTVAGIVDSCRRLMEEYQPDFYIYYTSPSPRWLETTCEEDYLSVPEYFEICQRLCELNVIEHWNVNFRFFQYPVQNGEASYRFLSKILKDGPVESAGLEPLMNCEVACTRIHVATDGRVLPCSGFEGTSRVEGFMVDDDLNIYNRSLADILSKSEYLHIFKPTIDDLREKEESCKDCRWIEVCRGGCRLLALDKIRKSVEYDRKSEYQCLFFRGGFAERYVKAMEAAYGECY